MYDQYFGLKESPFSIAPNPRYLYMSERHREALAHLLYGIRTDGGFILLTGEVGTGKTTVCRCLLEQLPDNVDTAFVLNPKLTADELLATICDDLGIDYPDNVTIKGLVDRLNDFLLSSLEADRRTVLIIDEAQNLSADVLEQLRLLTNLETNQRKLLQIILLGQPELLELLSQPELRQLSQRITARFHLDALNREEVAEYIEH
ncbi:MAG: AAA family ATPase, partial [Pseudomonadales bacterium]|nr:AAA family ATPase [Pseudomonadales bacterium]